MKIILRKKATGLNYSIEAGLHDGVKNFDHHGPHSGNQCPANNDDIPIVAKTATIEITHIDADSYLGILRMAGLPLPKIDFDILEKIDLNGSSVIDDPFNPTLLYMVGISQLARKVGFPRCSEEPQDVTRYAVEMSQYGLEYIQQLGLEAQEKSEKSFQACLVKAHKTIGFWSIDATDAFDPSRPYQDGYEIVVVYRKHFQTISIYCSPNSNFEFAGRTIAGVKFAGHPKACGSPRGERMSEAQADEVFEQITGKEI